MVNSWISVLAIVGPTIIALASLLNQSFSSLANNRLERAKLFYNDRLKALLALNREVSSILRSMEEVLNYKRIMTGKIPFQDLFDNTESRLPAPLHQQFQSLVYNATINGRNKFRLEVDTNGLFYTGNIRKLIRDIDDQVLKEIPEPLYPATIDSFIENKIELLRNFNESLNNECQKFLMVNKV